MDLESALKEMLQRTNVREVIVGHVNVAVEVEDGTIFDKVPVTDNREVLPEWFFKLRDRKPARHTPANALVSGKTDFTIIAIPASVSNNSGITCQDCGSTKLSTIVKHANGSKLVFCKRHAIRR